MSYPPLRQGDKLPAVGVLQKLLNRGGKSLNPDADSDSRIKAALLGFQTPRRLGANGKVGEGIWPTTLTNANLPVVDCIEVFDVVQAIADELRVPVSAGINTQLGGGTKTFRFGGPTFTASPSGTLAQCSRALPNFAGFNPS